MKLLRFVLLGAILIPSTNAWSRWANRTVPVPVDRLVENAGKYITENPKDPRGYYVLGRLHSLAFARRTDTLRVIQSGDLPGFAPWENIMAGKIREPEKLKGRARIHLRESIRNYRKATELDGKNPLVFLGLAWVIEEGARQLEALEIRFIKARALKDISGDDRGRYRKLVELLGEDDAVTRESAAGKLNKEIGDCVEFLRTLKEDDPEIRTRLARLIDLFDATSWAGDDRPTEKKALEAYRKAYALAKAGDLKKNFRGPGANGLVSLEAGQAIVRILKAGKPGRAEKKEIEKIEATLAELNGKRRMMTPIIFPMNEDRPLDALLSDTEVAFDMDGDGIPRMWPWVRPDTAILVWDPGRTGKVESGMQLFGSVTWWIFWDHGYQPLDLLDDDRNGRLTGSELAFLGVWTDRNGNGVSDPGEVRSLASAGITAIEARPAGRHADVPFHPAGVRFADGRSVPTYDWTPTSLRP